MLTDLSRLVMRTEKFFKMLQAIYAFGSPMKFEQAESI